MRREDKTLKGLLESRSTSHQPSTNQNSIKLRVLPSLESSSVSPGEPTASSKKNNLVRRIAKEIRKGEALTVSLSLWHQMTGEDSRLRFFLQEEIP